MDTDGEFWGVVGALGAEHWMDLDPAEARTYVAGALGDAFVAAGPAAASSPAVATLATLLDGLAAGTIRGLALDSRGTMSARA